MKQEHPGRETQESPGFSRGEKVNLSTQRWTAPTAVRDSRPQCSYRNGNTRAPPVESNSTETATQHETCSSGLVSTLLATMVIRLQTNRPVANLARNPPASAAGRDQLPLTPPPPPHSKAPRQEAGRFYVSRVSRGLAQQLLHTHCWRFSSIKQTRADPR